MGQLVEGRWSDEWYDTGSSGGRFVRKDSAFREWVRADGSGAFSSEPGRYHLYVSLACPWAHRTLVVRSLKKLADAIARSPSYTRSWERTAGASRTRTARSP